MTAIFSMWSSCSIAASSPAYFRISCLPVWRIARALSVSRMTAKYGVVAAKRADHIGRAHGVDRHCRRLSQTGQRLDDDHVLRGVDIGDALTENVAQTRGEAVCRTGRSRRCTCTYRSPRRAILISRSSLMSRETGRLRGAVADRTQMVRSAPPASRSRSRSISSRIFACRLKFHRSRTPLFRTCFFFIKSQLLLQYSVKAVALETDQPRAAASERVMMHPVVRTHGEPLSAVRRDEHLAAALAGCGDGRSVRSGANTNDFAASACAQMGMTGDDSPRSAR